MHRFAVVRVRSRACSARRRHFAVLPRRRSLAQFRPAPSAPISSSARSTAVAEMPAPRTRTTTSRSSIAARRSVSLDGKSLQYASATGTGNLGPLPPADGAAGRGRPAPGQYFLVQEASQAAVGAPLPSPDIIDRRRSPWRPDGRQGRSGHRATSLGCNGGCDVRRERQRLARIVDLVGYGRRELLRGCRAGRSAVRTPPADFRSGSAAAWTPTTTVLTSRRRRPPRGTPSRCRSSAPPIVAPTIADRLAGRRCVRRGARQRRHDHVQRARGRLRRLVRDLLHRLAQPPGCGHGRPDDVHAEPQRGFRSGRDLQRCRHRGPGHRPGHGRSA